MSTEFVPTEEKTTMESVLRGRLQTALTSKLFTIINENTDKGLNLKLMAGQLVDTVLEVFSGLETDLQNINEQRELQLFEEENG